MKILMWIYLNFIRRFTSPLIYWVFKFTKYRGDNPSIFNTIKDLPIDEYHKEIAYRTAYEYHLDPLKGILDNSPQQKNFFFREDLDTSRDCNAWARIWKYYLDYHNIPNKEIAMLNTGQLFNGGLSAHSVTVAKIDGQWKLFDYRPIEQKEDTIEEVLKHNVVGYDKFVFLTLKG